MKNVLKDPGWGGGSVIKQVGTTALVSFMNYSSRPPCIGLIWGVQWQLGLESKKVARKSDLSAWMRGMMEWERGSFGQGRKGGSWSVPCSRMAFCRAWSQSSVTAGHTGLGVASVQNTEYSTGQSGNMRLRGEHGELCVSFLLGQNNFQSLNFYQLL